MNSKKTFALALALLMVGAAGFAGTGAAVALSAEEEIALLGAGQLVFVSQSGPGPCGFSARCDTGLPLGAQCNFGGPITCTCQSLTRNGCKP